LLTLCFCSAIYNEAYILLAGQKHPSLMGTSYRDAWAEIWDDVKDVFANAKISGEATMKDDDCLYVRRSNYLEECYFSWSIIPMVGRHGSVMGLYNPAFEKTRRKIAERRMLTLREIGERTAAARDVKAFWSQVLASFDFNELDSPFVLLYSVTEDNESDSSSITSNSVFSSRQCLLEGALGVPEGHQAAPRQIDLRAGMDGFGPVFREVMKTDKPLLLEVGNRELPQSLLEDLDWRGFGDPVTAVVVCPIHPTTGESVLGFLVLGVNPRRPYDDDYSLFVQLLNRQLATSLASVVLFEEEIRRGQKAAKLAALDRIELSQQLAARTQEAIDSETKFTRMAEFAPVGMFIANSDGKITFANETWYEISRVPRNSDMADTWMEAVKPDDLELVKQLWTDLVVNTKPVSREFRFKAQWQDRNGGSGDTWALFSGYPEKYDDGRLKSIFGSITDISQQKWAEGIQTRKMEEAVELKRQQENFIDITSHEMRNPLSAILQCSDDIASSVTKFRQSGERVAPDELLANCLDAAQTINLCSQHQKRIVDDILTLSKLDSKLLLVTPVDAQPLTVVQRALKMHEGELQAADIQMKFVVDHSFRDLNLDWVRFDPSRVMQVLINLTTNAIKFTGTESRRTITVTIGASVQRPSETSRAPVTYFPSRTKGKDVTSDDDWGDGDSVFIHFSVRDTGRGLSPEEKKLLFMRFSQASPRTHVQYGGSGLGLFISRELTELQGGEIGVESEAGKGSCFAFYVAAKRSTRPKDTLDAGLGLRRTPSHNPRSKSEPSATLPQGAPVQTAAGKRVLGSHASDAPIKKVLIVEDNLVNQRVLQKQLKNHGAEVHLANHGGEALDKLMQSTYWRDGPHSPDTIELGVVLMDQEMPVVSGLTCTRKIRELEAQGKLTGHVPIIGVTANARSEQIQTALDAGMVSLSSQISLPPPSSFQSHPIPSLPFFFLRVPYMRPMPIAPSRTHARTWHARKLKQASIPAPRTHAPPQTRS
jgi:PAS domain S-box-containing protein